MNSLWLPNCIRKMFRHTAVNKAGSQCFLMLEKERQWAKMEECLAQRHMGDGNKSSRKKNVWNIGGESINALLDFNDIVHIERKRTF